MFFQDFTTSCATCCIILSHIHTKIYMCIYFYLLHHYNSQIKCIVHIGYQITSILHTCKNKHFIIGKNIVCTSWQHKTVTWVVFTEYRTLLYCNYVHRYNKYTCALSVAKNIFWHLHLDWDYSNHNKLHRSDILHHRYDC